MQTASNNANGIIENTVKEMSVNTVTPDQCTVFRCGVHFRDRATVHSVFAWASNPELRMSKRKET